MTKLWDYFDGEPFLDNPNLAVLTNPKSKRRRKPSGRRKTMARRLPARNRKGQFVKRGSSHKRATTRRRRRTVGVRTGAFGRRIRRVKVVRRPALVNPRRRRRSTRRRYATVLYNPRRSYRRRSYRRNPVRLGSIFSKPTLKNVGFAVVGLAGTPMLYGFASQYLPTVMTGNQWGRYATKAASAWVLSFGVGKIAGREAERSVLIGGLAYVAMGLIQDFFPTLLSIGGGTSSTTGRYLTGAGKQPLLAGQGRYLRGPMTNSTPGRLDPGSRF